MIDRNQIPTSWEVVKLGALVSDPKRDLVDGPFGSNLRANEYTDKGIPVFKIQNIKANRFIDKNINYITEEKAKTLARHSFVAGDLIITKLGDPLGLCCKVPQKYPYGIIVADLMRLRPGKTAVLDKFLVFSINSNIVQNQFKLITKGTTRPRVNLTIVRELELPLPPLPEQHRIVSKIEELFSELDKGIESLKTARQQLKIYRQAVLKWAFEGRLTNENIKDGELPSGWKLLKLKDITKEKDGLRRGPFGSAIKKEFFVADGYKVYEQGNAINDDPYRGKYFIDGKKYRELINFKVIPGDLIVSCSGVTLGRISEIPEDGKPGIINQALLRIRLKNDIIANKYFILHFRAAFFQKKIFDQSQGTAMPNLVGIKDFKEIELFVPTKEEQHQIVQEIETRLSVCDKLEETITTALKQSDALRQSILKKAFEGKLVEQNPNDEPATKLLERIKVEREKDKAKNETRKKKIPKG